MSFCPFTRRPTRKAPTKNNEAPELDLDVPILETAANPLPQTEIVNVVTPVTDETLAGVDVVPLAHEEEEATKVIVDEPDQGSSEELTDQEATKVDEPDQERTTDPKKEIQGTERTEMLFKSPPLVRKGGIVARKWHRAQMQCRIRQRSAPRAVLISTPSFTTRNNNGNRARTTTE